jgi:cold shock protein
MRGKVTKIIHVRGYGFISDAEGNDYFLLYKEVIAPNWTELREGDDVTFTVGKSPKGPTALGVERAAAI